MKMDIRHDLPAPIDVAWREIFSEAYIEASRAKTQTSTEPLGEEQRPDGKRLKRTRVRLDRELPSVVANLLGSKHLVYTLEELIDDRAYQVHWRVIPDKVADRVKAEGTFTLQPAGAGSCRRVVAGEVRVNVPLVGGRIEKGIAADLEKSYEATAAFAREWLASRA